MADGFLGRWSQRKQAVREGKPLTDPPPAAAPAPVAVATTGPTALAPHNTAPERQTQRAEQAAADAPPAAPALSLDDVKALTAESDYAPFVSRSVAPDVRNAAMKKLFTDPHYNVMDRLDIYIDDYSLPDPLPASMLRQMASAKFLKLFDEEDKDAKVTPLGDDANRTALDSVAQSNPTITSDSGHDTESAAVLDAPLVSENLPVEPGLDHDHTDLRLQPNHAAGPQEPGHSTQ
jgi:hypothetical protein